MVIPTLATVGGGAATAMSDVPATGPNWFSMFAVMLTVPTETPVASPAVLIVAKEELDDFHVTWLVTYTWRWKSERIWYMWPVPGIEIFDRRLLTWSPQPEELGAR
jgi:hypothetical protein